jgi:hypothetical protein
MIPRIITLLVLFGRSVMHGLFYLVYSGKFQYTYLRRQVLIPCMVAAGTRL